MILKFFLAVVILPLGLFAIFMIARNLWKKADMKETLNEIKSETEMYNDIKDINMEEVVEHKKTLKKFIKK